MSIRRRSRFSVGLCIAAIGLVGAVFSTSLSAASSKKSPAIAARQSAEASPVDPDSVHIHMRNVVFRVLPNVALNIQRLDGVMVQSRPGQIVSLDDPNSFTLNMQSADSSISSRNLSALVNTYILPRAGTPIRDLTMKLNPDQTISVTGTLHKVIDIPFQATATVRPTPNGNLRMHFSDMRVGRIIDQSVLDFLGMNVSKFAQPKNPQAFRVEGNDMVFPISQMFPPPHVSGKLQSLAILKGRLHFVFGAVPAPAFAPPNPAPNYVFFRGGSMRFGRLTMSPVEMQLVNLKPAGAFDFSLAQYFKQLVAGYSNSLPGGGLLVHMANYRDVLPQPHK